MNNVTVYSDCSLCKVPHDVTVSVTSSKNLNFMKYLNFKTLSRFYTKYGIVIINDSKLDSNIFYDIVYMNILNY